MDCQFCGRPGTGPYCLTPPAPGVPSCEDCAREACQVVGEGPDIAPGLTALFTAAWAPAPIPAGRPLWLPCPGNPC
jgi:hypothetical protein